VKRYLLGLLTGIFIVQFSFYAYGVWHCTWHGRSCPQVADRLDAVFTTALATVLSLMNVERK